jgi:hypothetical protein
MIAQEVAVGISATDFWNTSKNGKAMIVMLAKRGDVELCREICEWLVSEKRKGVAQDARASGRSEEQGRIIATEACGGLQRAAETISDKNVEGQTAAVVDALYAKYYAAGKAVYDKAMSDLADALRKKVRD